MTCQKLYQEQTIFNKKRRICNNELIVNHFLRILFLFNHCFHLNILGNHRLFLLFRLHLKFRNFKLLESFSNFFISYYCFYCCKSCKTVSSMSLFKEKVWLNFLATYFGSSSSYKTIRPFLNFIIEPKYFPVPTLISNIKKGFLFFFFLVTMLGGLNFSFFLFS